MTTILLTHTPEMRRNYYGERALAGLRAIGDVRLHEGDRPLDGSSLVDAARGATLIVADRQTPGPGHIFAALPDLTAFIRVAVDISTIEVPAATAAGVLVTRASPGFIAAVTELVLGFLVDLSRGIGAAAHAYRQGHPPSAKPGRELRGKTLGVIGFGAIGRNLAPVGRALGMRVLVADPYATVTGEGIEHVELDALLARSDYVVCLAVANAETENLMNDAAFARMKPSACFINVSRGGLVDDAALERALTEGRIAGAALDVGRAPDQMPVPRVAALPNVIATPHIGGLTPEAIEHQALETVRQAQAILRGEAPAGAVNAEHWARRPRGS